MNGLQVFGRILFGLAFVAFGMAHFVYAGDLSAYVPIPPQLFWVYVTGAVHLAAGLAFLFSRLVFWAGLLEGGQVLVFAFWVHLGAIVSGQQTLLVGMPAFLKGVAIAGAAFFLAGAAGRRRE